MRQSALRRPLVLVVALWSAGTCGAAAQNAPATAPVNVPANPTPNGVPTGAGSR